MDKPLSYSIKIDQLRTNLPLEPVLQLAQLCMVYEYLVKAILGFAWAVAAFKAAVHLSPRAASCCQSQHNPESSSGRVFYEPDYVVVI